MILSLLAACVSSKRTFYKIVTDKNYKLAIILMNFTKSAAEYFQNNNKQLTADYLKKKIHYLFTKNVSGLLLDI